MFPINKKKKSHYPQSYLDFLKLEEEKPKEEKSDDPFKAICKENRNYDIRVALAEEQGYVCCYCLQRIPDKTFAYREGEESVQKIGPEMNIEHYKANSNYDGGVHGKEHPTDERFCDDITIKRPDLRIEWTNWLCACLYHPSEKEEFEEDDFESKRKKKEAEEQEAERRHCGETKKDKELCFIPNPATLTKFNQLQLSCNSDGVLKSKDININEELGGVLNKSENNKEYYHSGKLHLNCQKLINLRRVAIDVVIRRLKDVGADWWKKQPKVIELVKHLYLFYKNRNKEGKFQPFYGYIMLYIESKFKKNELE